MATKKIVLPPFTVDTYELSRQDWIKFREFFDFFLGYEDCYRYNSFSGKTMEYSDHKDYTFGKVYTNFSEFKKDILSIKYDGVKISRLASGRVSVRKVKIPINEVIVGKFTLASDLQDAIISKLGAKSMKGIAVHKDIDGFQSWALSDNEGGRIIYPRNDASDSVPVKTQTVGTINLTGGMVKALKKDKLLKTVNTLTQNDYDGTFKLVKSLVTTVFIERNACDITRLDGSTVRALRGCNMPYSRRHHKWFESQAAATNAGFVKCPNTGDWLLESEVVLPPNAGYHNLERKFKVDNKVDFKIGFEIEKEDILTYPIPYKPLHDKTGWCKERDGSLGDNGYELVSPVFALFSDDLDEDIESSEELQRLINGDYSLKCGGHINISSKTYSPSQLLMGLKGFLPLLYSIWNIRMKNDYCTPQKIHQYAGKRGAMNIKSNVLEIRLAAAVKSVRNLLWRRDLVRIMIRHINKSELEVLRMMLNSKSALHKHLRKVYDSETFMKKCDMFIRHAEDFGEVKLKTINWDVLDGAKAESTPEVEED